MQRQHVLTETQQKVLEDAAKQLDQTFKQGRAKLSAADVSFGEGEGSTRCLRCDHCEGFSFGSGIVCTCGHRLGVHDVW